jgi:hypothetical protein
MPSRLRYQQHLAPQEVATSAYPTSSRPSKKQKMSLSQTYSVASSARSKLGKEATKADHNLRRLVGHANLLDALMLELRDAERQQEAWFNQTVRSAKKDEDRHIQWVDRIEEEDEEDSDSDSDSEFDEEEFEMAIPVRGIRQAPVTIISRQVDEEDTDDEDMYEDVDGSPELALTRTDSHPPELVHDSDSDDESPPSSPPTNLMEYSEKMIIDLTSKKMPQQISNYIIHDRAAPLIEAY